MNSSLRLCRASTIFQRVVICNFTHVNLPSNEVLKDSFSCLCQELLDRGLLVAPPGLVLGAKVGHEILLDHTDLVQAGSKVFLLAAHHLVYQSAKENDE